MQVGVVGGDGPVRVGLEFQFQFSSPAFGAPGFVDGGGQFRVIGTVRVVVPPDFIAQALVEKAKADPAAGFARVVFDADLSIPGSFRQKIGVALKSVRGITEAISQSRVSDPDTAGEINPGWLPGELIGKRDAPSISIFEILIFVTPERQVDCGLRVRLPFQHREYAGRDEAQRPSVAWRKKIVW